MAKPRNRRRDWTLWSRPLDPPGGWEYDGHAPTEVECWHLARSFWAVRGRWAQWEYLVLPPAETPHLKPGHA